MRNSFFDLQRFIMFQALSRFIFFTLMGWKIKGGFPKDQPKYLLVAAPHTSNWDFFLGLFSRSILQEDIKFIGKSSLFRPPIGWLFRALGGYPVDRSKSANAVDAIVDIYNRHERFATTIAPEGTRKKVDQFKSGFYYIALGAKIPLVLGRLDWGNKTVEFSEPFWPTGNFQEDMEFITNHFRGIQGKHPELGIHF